MPSLVEDVFFKTFLVFNFKNKSFQNSFLRYEPFGPASRTGLTKQHYHASQTGVIALFGHAV